MLGILHKKEDPGVSKHIIDGPRSRVTSERLEQFARIDLKTSGKPRPQSDQLNRKDRTRDSGQKLRRFAAMDRRS